MKKLIFLTMMFGLMMVFSSSASAQSCVPKNNQVALFQDINYGGECKVFNIGGYLDIVKAGFLEDEVSSFKVGRGVVLRLCQNKNYQDQKNGGCKEYTNDVAELTEGSTTPNDTVSSFVVFVRK